MGGSETLRQGRGPGHKLPNVNSQGFPFMDPLLLFPVSPVELVFDVQGLSRSPGEPVGNGAVGVSNFLQGLQGVGQGVGLDGHGS